MSIIKEIKFPVKEEMSLFEKKFKDSLNTNVALIDKIMYYIIKRKGKQIRPLFVFLSAKLFNEFQESTYRAATMIELLHTATLVHDDVTDNSNFRRGFFSINALWKNKVAVLVGDFLLSKGLLLAVKNNEFDLLKIMSASVEEMSEGELLQIEKSRTLNITEDVYFEIIRKKTATLIGACCAAGASSVKQNENIINQLRLFGENVGIAFQIKDDLFDYTKNPIIGKPTGIDIKEKKLTLPLIYTLSKIDAEKKKYILNIVKNQSDNSAKVNEIISIVKQNQGIEYAEKKMFEYHAQAMQILSQFNNNDARKSLVLLLDFVINRKK
jgi:octaprenyl-diphosphate synthase